MEYYFMLGGAGWLWGFEPAKLEKKKKEEKRKAKANARYLPVSYKISVKVNEI
jgi:hypothetical protein